MVLEACMIVIDNSEYMRNGDYTPTRFAAQVDAVSLIFTSKTQSNPENTVGLMTLGGSGPDVKVTLTSDFGKILSGIHDTKIHGDTHLVTAINVAALVLKHRQNKVQRQRIVVFVASPIKEQNSELIKLAKKMKKNNVAVDFINFGEESDNTDKLEAFIDQVNSGDNSHLVTIPPGPHLLSDMLTSTPIINEDMPGGMGGGLDGGLGGAGAGAGAGDMFEFGVDPSVDPELALALRMSLEDEKARQEREKAKQAKSEPEAATETGSKESGAASTSEESKTDSKSENAEVKKKEDDDDAMKD